MSKQQLTNLGPNIQSFCRQEKVSDSILPNNSRSSNSAKYIPTSIYQNSNNSNSRQQLTNNNNPNTSQLTHTSQHSNMLTTQQLSSYQKLSQLTQRLKNIHHFYKLRIQQQRLKNTQRNEVFMSIVQQLQRNHNQRIMVIKSEIQCVQQDKREVGYVDERVSQIKLSINELLGQSAAYKSSNQQLQKQITIKQQAIRQKQKQLSKVIRQQKQFRDQLEQLMKMSVKQSKKQRDMLEIIDKEGVR